MFLQPSNLTGAVAEWCLPLIQVRQHPGNECGECATFTSRKKAHLARTLLQALCDGSDEGLGAACASDVWRLYGCWHSGERI